MKNNKETTSQLCTKEAAGKNFIALARIALQKGWNAKELMNFVLLIEEKENETI